MQIFYKKQDIFKYRRDRLPKSGTPPPKSLYTKKEHISKTFLFRTLAGHALEHKCLVLQPNMLTVRVESYDSFDGMVNQD